MNSHVVRILIPLILIGTAVVDAIMPIGYEVWVGHIFAVLMTIWVGWLRAAYVVAAIATLFVCVGFILSPAGAPLEVAIFNRIVGVSLLWVTAVLVGQVRTTKLDAAARQLATIVDSSNDAILGLTPDGLVTSWNTGAQRIFGFTAGEMVGRSIQMLIPSQLHAEEATLRDQVQAGSYAHTYDAIRITKDGRYLDVSVTLSPLKDRVGRIMGVSTIIRDISERKRAQALLQQALGSLEKIVQERTAELSSANSSLRELSGRLMQVQEEERSRLARDLHDEVGQLLTALKIDLQELQHGQAGQACPGSLRDSLGLVDRLLTQVRNLALDLRPSILDDLGLESALRWYANRQAGRNGWTLSVAVEGKIGRIPASIEIACFRVAQEVLTNVARHAGAKMVGMTLCRQDQLIALTIHDDGVGFDVQQARQRAQGGESIGLLSMEERVRLAGGNLTISSTPGHGTQLALRFPLDEPQPNEVNPTVEVMSS